MHASSEMGAVMASVDPSCAAELTPVVGGDGVIVLAVDAVDPNAVPSMVTAGTVSVEASSKVQSNVGAALG